MAKKQDTAAKAREDTRSKAREDADARAEGHAASISQGAEVDTNKDTFVRAPSTPIPATRQPVPGETNLDPLGVGANPSNAVMDPTDTRAVGKQSARYVEAAGEREDETKSRADARNRADKIMREHGGMATFPGLAFVAPPRPREIEMLEGETVRLTAPHYFDQVYETGAVLENYHGP